ncbi:MAG: FAD-dependent thymidylate synthase, partial [Clostridiales bacterium]
SYSQKSQRYVKEKGFVYIIPPAVEQNGLGREFQLVMEEIQDAYDRLIAAGIAMEDARYLLPNATATNLILTMNARSLHNFFRLRCCSRAQWEIRQMAYLMLGEVKQVAPALFAQAGPSCETEYICYEGEKCCKPGQVEVRQR